MISRFLLKSSFRRWENSGNCQVTCFQQICWVNSFHSPKCCNSSSAQLSAHGRPITLHDMHDRGPFFDIVFLATLCIKNAAIVIVICTTTYMSSLSPIGPILRKIFAVFEGWVLSDVQVRVSTITASGPVFANFYKLI